MREATHGAYWTKRGGNARLSLKRKLNSRPNHDTGDEEGQGGTIYAGEQWVLGWDAKHNSMETTSPSLVFIGIAKDNVYFTKSLLSFADKRISIP